MVEHDGLLLLRQLSNNGCDVNYERVMTAAAMAPLLVDGRWDVVVSDCAMPGFGALMALELLQKSGLDLPFIIVSGTIGEETAVGALKAGAHDSLLKSKLARLMPTIDREVREVQVRRDRRNSEKLLRDSELKYRQIVETAQEGIWMMNGEGQTTFVNKRMAQLLNVDADKLLGASFFEFLQGRAVIECRDTGPGISPDVLRRLFTPFFTTKAPAVGTGLGLSISHRIVASLGGEITVESEVGKGSVLRVTLPPSSRETVPAAATAAVVPEVVAAPRRPRLLVVDDEPMLLTVLRKALSLDYEVSITESPQAALMQVLSLPRRTRFSIASRTCASPSPSTSSA